MRMCEKRIRPVAAKINRNDNRKSFVSGRL
jgi:hypothetical protein